MTFVLFFNVYTVLVILVAYNLQKKVQSEIVKSKVTFLVNIYFNKKLYLYSFGLLNDSFFVFQLKLNKKFNF